MSVTGWVSELSRGNAGRPIQSRTVGAAWSAATPFHASRFARYFVIDFDFPGVRLLPGRGSDLELDRRLFQPYLTIHKGFPKGGLWLPESKFQRSLQNHLAEATLSPRP